MLTARWSTHEKIKMPQSGSVVLALVVELIRRRRRMVDCHGQKEEEVDYMGLRGVRLCCGAAKGGRLLPGLAEVGNLAGDVTPWRRGR